MRVFPLLILTILLAGFMGLAILLAGYVEQKEFGIKIVDQAGREVEIGKVERIVSLWPEATRVLFALGIGDRIVGLDSYSKTCPILIRAFPEIRNVTDVGSPLRGTLSIEKLAQLKPDIIFMRTDDPELADKLQESLGVPVVCVRMHPPPERKVSFDMITIIGKCVGKEKRAEEIKNYLERKLSEITSVTSKIPDSERPKVYQAFAFDLLKTIGYFDVIELAGGKNVAESGSKEQPWYTVSLEDLLRWNPDIIILHGFGRFMPEDVLNDPNWQQIKAVKEGKVYRLTLGWAGWDPAGFVINVMQNAKAFHPDRFTFDIEEESNDIFKFVYGVDSLYTKLKDDYKLSVLDI